MDIATIINIILCILSFMLAAISVVTIVITIRQNSTMIENSSRAYVSIYGDVINCQNLSFYIIIKNFGQSSALVTSLKCNTDLSKFSFNKNLHPFSHIEGTSIAPNQTLKCTLDHLELFNAGISSLNFEISYESNNKKYFETYCINLNIFSELICTRPSANGKELHTLSCALQELNERLL